MIPRSSDLWTEPMMGVWSDADIARAYGVSRERVRAVRAARGIAPPPRAARSKHTPEAWKIAGLLRARRWTYPEIERVTGIHHGALYRRFKGSAKGRAPLDRYDWAYGHLPDRIIARCAGVTCGGVSTHRSRRNLPRMLRKRALSWHYVIRRRFR